MTILGIETSCDDTSVAVLSDAAVLSSLVSSQVGGRHFGGIVPELAARAHQANLLPVVRAALEESGVTKEQIDLVCVTSGPGLIGSLMVGVQFAKGLAFSIGVPLMGVHHMEAHFLAAFIGDDRLEFPFIALIVSGGHTLLVKAEALGIYDVLGETRDDAAGECFDKVARVIGLEPQPGSLMAGPVIDRLAVAGDRQFVNFPRPMLRSDDLNFSFSGLKTAVINCVNQEPKTTRSVAYVSHICASFQEAVVDVLTEKSMKACRQHGIHRLVLCGGVAANSRLRERMEGMARDSDIALFIPPKPYCTDNAAMIAWTGWLYHQNGEESNEVVPLASMGLGRTK